MPTYLIVITDTHFGQVQHGRSGPLQANPDYSTSASATTQEPPYNQAVQMEPTAALYRQSSSASIAVQLLSQTQNPAAEGHGDLFGVRFTAFSASAVESGSAFAFSASCKSHSFTAFSMSANA